MIRMMTHGFRRPPFQAFPRTLNIVKALMSGHSLCVSVLLSPRSRIISDAFHSLSHLGADMEDLVVLVERNLYGNPLAGLL